MISLWPHLLYWSSFVLFTRHYVSDVYNKVYVLLLRLRPSARGQTPAVTAAWVSDTT
jgi:hypothetical protein